MSVLIKNMEMPEHCGYCRFRYDGICHALQKTQYSEKECPLVSVNDKFESVPSAQPERKKGKWIDKPVYIQTWDGKTWDGCTYCSECREMHEYGYRSSFCPGCGAEMTN